MYSTNAIPGILTFKLDLISFLYLSCDVSVLLGKKDLPKTRRNMSHDESMLHESRDVRLKYSNRATTRKRD